jgi:hypothetical protein
VTEQLDAKTKTARILANARLLNIDEVPFVVEVGPVHLATKDFFDNPDAEIKWNYDFHKQREGLCDYAFPNIKPNTGINIIAEAFGCECRVNGEADPWVRCRISEENARDVHTLAVPDPVNNPAFKRAWDRLDYLQSHSDPPLRLCNVPSPLVTASLIWDYTGFIEALLVCPDEVHVLMQKVTRATILYIKEQLGRIKNIYSVGHELWGLPREMGVRVSDDTAALLSPELYREFGVQYNAMIAREFGGIVVHSCGDVHNVAKVMLEIPGITGVDFTIPQVEHWESVRDAVAGKTALFLRHCYWDHLGETMDVTGMAAYTKKLVDFFGRKGLFIQTSMPEAEEAAALSKKLHGLLN